MGQHSESIAHIHKYVHRYINLNVRSDPLIHMGNTANLPDSEHVKILSICIVNAMDI